MPAIQATDINDLVNSVISQYAKDIMVDAATTLRDYPAASRLLNENKRTFGGGDQYKFNVLYDGDGNAKNIGFFTPDNLDQVNATVQGTIPWRFTQSGAHYDVKQISVNSGSNAIYNFIKKLEYQMWIDLFELNEANIWDGPSASTDNTTPFGFLKYWFAYNATEGFNGGNHTNFSGGPAGISRTTYTTTKHYTANYAAVTDADLIAKMRKAYRNCGFRGIPNKPIKDVCDMPDHEIFTTLDTLMGIEDLIDTKNENFGVDLTRYDNAIMFRRVPVVEVPYLQANHSTSDPVLGICWKDINMVCPEGEWMRTTNYLQSSDHDVYKRFVNMSYNIALHTSRKHFMIAKSDPMSD